MRWLSRIVRRSWYLLRRGSAEREMDEEMRFHVEMEIEDRVRRGMSPDEARRTALMDFGGVERFKEEGRDARGVRPLEDIAQDVRYAARTLGRTPGFTVAAVHTLGLGIAATTVVVSVVNALFLRPFPVKEPERLFVVDEIWRGGYTSTSMARPMFSYERYMAYRDGAAAVFDGVAGFIFFDLSVRIGDEARIHNGIIASQNYFQVLGIRPALGRTFVQRAGESESMEPEVVIGYDFWQRQFAGDPSVLGRTLNVNSRPLTIVGVAPRGFHGTQLGLAADLWVPAAVHRDAPPGTGAAGERVKPDRAHLTIFGRLRPGTGVEQARAALKVIAPALPTQESKPPEVTDVTLDPLSGVPTMARRQTVGFMTMLSVMAALVLLIAVTNVAGMLLARATYRQREIAVRLAIGAGSGRILRQLVTESVALCVLGAAAGLLCARWLLGLIPAVQPPIAARVALDLTLDPRVLAIAMSLGLAAGMVAGLAPAVQATRPDLLSALRSTEGGSVRRSRLRSAFVVTQLAMSLVLLATAGLFMRALQRALAIDPGFDPRGVAVASVRLAPHGYNRERGAAFYAQLLERLRARPEVAAAAIARYMPLSSGYMGEGVLAPGEAAGGKRIHVMKGYADVGYLEMLRVPMVAGRTFTNADGPGAPHVMVVNETFARRFWPGESPIGKSLAINGAPHEVIGVSRDGKYQGLDDGPRAYAYFPYAQTLAHSPDPMMMVYTRARGETGAALAAIRTEVAALDPNIALEQAAPLTSQLDLLLLPQRLCAWLIGGFGLVGLALASIGLYGVVAYDVAQRTREFGIRLALGAGGGAIVHGVLRRALWIVGIGAAAGVTLSLGAGYLARSFLFGVGPSDPVTLVAAPLLLAAVALIASYIPARRAARVDPMVSLRAE